MQELALWHKARSTGQWAIALSHYEWCFCCFFLSLHRWAFRRENLLLVLLGSVENIFNKNPKELLDEIDTLAECLTLWVINLLVCKHPAALSLISLSLTGILSHQGKNHDLFQIWKNRNRERGRLAASKSNNWAFPIIGKRRKPKGKVREIRG